MKLQIETVTLLDGSKMDVIRDIEKVRRLLSTAGKAFDAIRDWECGHKPNGVGGNCDACESLKEWDKL